MLKYIFLTTILYFMLVPELRPEKVLSQHDLNFTGIMIMQQITPSDSTSLNTSDTTLLTLPADSILMSTSDSISISSDSTLIPILILKSEDSISLSSSDSISSDSISLNVSDSTLLTMPADTISLNTPESAPLKIEADSIIKKPEPIRQKSSTEISTSPSNFISSFNKDSLKTAWFQYISAIRDAGVTIKAEEEQFITDYSSGDTTQYVSENVVEKTVPKTISNGESIIYSEADTAVYTFYVQIAASRSPMDSAEIKRLYKGPHQIVTQKEDGWHKYRFGKTSDYKEAFENLYAQKIPDAFIVVYKNTGEKMELWEVLREKRKTVIKSNSVKNFEFRVQLIASKTKVHQSELEKIYSGNQPVTELQEDGWHKYQIVTGNNYSDAKELLKNLNIKDAFIVAYENQEKIELYKAILKTKNR
jgi:hypothetical protein